MMKAEFEELAIRKNAEISYNLYDYVESFYASDNIWHKNHGGVDETKQDFVKRVFGGKVNTPKTVMEKITKEAIAENRYCLQGCGRTKKELDEMDTLLTERIEWLARN